MNFMIKTSCMRIYQIKLNKLYQNFSEKSDSKVITIRSMLSVIIEKIKAADKTFLELFESI